MLPCLSAVVPQSSQRQSLCVPRENKFFVSLLKREFLFQSKRASKLFTCYKSKLHQTNVVWDAEAGTSISKLALPLGPEFFILLVHPHAKAAELAGGWYLWKRMGAHLQKIACSWPHSFICLTLARCLHFCTSELAFNSAVFVPLYFKLMFSQSLKAMQLWRLELKRSWLQSRGPGDTWGHMCDTHAASFTLFLMWMIIVKYVKADSLRKWNKSFSRLNRYRKYIILRVSNPSMTWQESSREFLLNCCANLTFLLCGEISSVLCYDQLCDTTIVVFTCWTADLFIE